MMPVQPSDELLEHVFSSCLAAREKSTTEPVNWPIIKVIMQMIALQVLIFAPVMDFSNQGPLLH